MQYYKTDENRRGRLMGIIGVVVYFVVCLLLMLFINFRFATPPPQAEGMLINFGDSEQGLGDVDLADSDNVGAPMNGGVSSESEEDILTDDNSDVLLPSTPTPTPRPTTQNPSRSTPTSTPSVAPTPQVDQQALFPGRTAGSTATSQGTTSGAGNQGHLSGDPAGSNDGTGQGSWGGDFDLAGRSSVGSLPRPEYRGNVAGKVRIEIIVDPNGKVTTATYIPSGSTTNNSDLVEAARRAALKAKFSVATKELQRGVITYIYKLQ